MLCSCIHSNTHAHRFEKGWSCLSYTCFGATRIPQEGQISEPKYAHTEIHMFMHTHDTHVHRCQDHGWCFSYTCLKRLMTFWSIISMHQDYTIHFTGSNPQTLRFSLLDSNPELVTIVKIFYPKSSRLLVCMYMYVFVCLSIFVCEVI